MSADLDAIQAEAMAALAAAGSPEALAGWKGAWIGGNGRLKSLMAGLKDVPKEQKGAVGKRLNELKAALEAAYESRRAAVEATAGPRGPLVDVTEPGTPVAEGCR
ncbi:MAG: phenylalanine--tRNA ligase subunit alpha, partial [Phycisphaerales bacterium]